MKKKSSLIEPPAELYIVINNLHLHKDQIFLLKSDLKSELIYSVFSFIYETVSVYIKKGGLAFSTEVSASHQVFNYVKDLANRIEILETESYDSFSFRVNTNC